MGYERHVPGFSKHDPDRLVWLAFAAALFMAVFAWPVYEEYDYMRPLGTDGHRHPPLWGWAGLPVAVVLPWAAGDLSGRARRRWLANRPESLPRDRPDSPTGFDYVMSKSLRGQSSATTLWLQLKGDEGRQYVVVGRLKSPAQIGMASPAFALVRSMCLRLFARALSTHRLSLTSRMSIWSRFTFMAPKLGFHS